MLANWVRQSTVTTGDDLSITLGAIAGRPTFLNTHAADAQVKYAVLSGDGVSREEGTGVIRAGGILERTTPSVTWDGATYDRTSPARISLFGTSIVYITVGELDIVTADSVTTLTNKIINDASNTVHADATHVQVRNVSGSTIDAGSPVYISGYNVGQDVAEVEPSDADDAATMPALGVADEDIGNNSNGHIISAGQIAGLDTTAWAVNDTLFVSTTPGVLTNVRPTGLAEEIQAIAIVERSHITLGRIFVYGAGRANDVPNNLGDTFADNLTINAAGHLLLPLDGDTVTPTLGFGDGDTGLYESSDDVLNIGVGGVLKWVYAGGFTLLTTLLEGSNITNPVVFFASTATSTVPVYVLSREDPDTGLGSAGADQLSLIAGNLEGIRITEASSAITIDMFGQTIFPSVNDLANPTIAFGDGDSGFFEAADDAIRVAISGANVLQFFSGGLLIGSSNGKAYLPNVIVTSTVPGYAVRGDDSNTGIGSGGADQINLITGGITAVDYVEANSHVLHTDESHIGITASTTQTQGNGQLFSSHNEVTTVANPDDVVTLPDPKAGRHCEIFNDTTNRLQIFPKSGHELGAGTDISMILEPKQTITFKGSDATNWHISSSTQNFHAEFWAEDDANLFTINDSDGDVHAYHSPNLAAGDLNGWLFDAGGAGTSFPIASIADGADSGVDIEVTTTGSHGLAVGDVISQTDLGDPAYVGMRVVKAIISATAYEVLGVFTATDTGTMDQAATLEVLPIAVGDYDLKYTTSSKPDATNETFTFQFYHYHVDDEIVEKVEKTKARRKFGSGGDYGSTPGIGFHSFESGDKLCWGLANISSAADITVENLTVNAKKL